MILRMIYFSANEMAPARQIQLQKETCEGCFQVSTNIWMCQGHGATEDFSALWKLQLKRPHFHDDILRFLHEYSLILKCKQKNFLKHPLLLSLTPTPTPVPHQPYLSSKRYLLWAICRVSCWATFRAFTWECVYSSRLLNTQFITQGLRYLTWHLKINGNLWIKM